MLGRGVKRKWSCLEELEAETLHTAAEKEQNAEGEGGFLATPSKSDPSHLQQRQLVLGLCMEKLRGYQAGVELSLRRSVLLINTLRQIQEDMQSDGASEALLLHGVHHDSCLLGDEFGEDVPVTCPGCAEDDVDNVDNVDNVDVVDDVDDLSPSPPLSPEFSSQEADGSSDQQKSLPAAAAINTFSDAVNAMGYLGDLALDMDIFEDIDTSMYETSDLPSSWAAGSLWPFSVSLWADEDVKSRPPVHGGAGGLQSCRTDLNELDHIMEILVKT